MTLPPVMFESCTVPSHGSPDGLPPHSKRNILFEKGDAVWMACAESDAQKTGRLRRHLADSSKGENIQAPLTQAVNTAPHWKPRPTDVRHPQVDFGLVEICEVKVCCLYLLAPWPHIILVSGLIDYMQGRQGR